MTSHTRITFFLFRHLQCFVSPNRWLPLTCYRGVFNSQNVHREQPVISQCAIGNTERNRHYYNTSHLSTTSSAESCGGNILTRSVHIYILWPYSTSLWDTFRCSIGSWEMKSLHVSPGSSPGPPSFLEERLWE